MVVAAFCENYGYAVNAENHIVSFAAIAITFGNACGFGSVFLDCALHFGNKGSIAPYADTAQFRVFLGDYGHFHGFVLVCAFAEQAFCRETLGPACCGA